MSEDVNTNTGVSSKLQAVIGQVYGQALQNISLGETTDDRLAAANDILYSYIENSSTLTEEQKSVLMSEIDKQLNSVYLNLTGIDLSTVGKDMSVGWVEGLNTGAPTVNQAGTDMGNGLLGTMKEVLGVTIPYLLLICKHVH